MSHIEFSPKELIALAANNVLKAYLMVNGTDEQTASIFGAALSGAIKGITIKWSKESIRSELNKVIQSTWREIFANVEFDSLSSRCKDELMNRCITADTAFIALNSNDPYSAIRKPVIAILKRNTSWRGDEISKHSRYITDTLLLAVNETIEKDGILTLLKELEGIAENQRESVETINNLSDHVNKLQTSVNSLSQKVESMLFISSLELSYKKYKLGKNILFIYDTPSFIYSIKDHSYKEIEHEMSGVLCCLIKERGLAVSIKQLNTEYRNFAKETFAYQGNKNKSDMAIGNFSIVELNKALSTSINDDIVLEKINDNSVRLNLNWKKRLTPKTVYRLLTEEGKPKRMLDVFQSELSFFQFLLPDLFYKLLLDKGDYKSFSDLYGELFDRLYLTNSSLYVNIRELLLCNNDIMYFVSQQCKAIVESLESFDSFISSFQKEFGEEPLRGSCINGLTVFYSIISEMWRLRDMKSSDKLFYLIAFSFLYENVFVFPLATKKSNEIDAMSLTIGSRHFFTINSRKKAMLYCDSDLLFDLVCIYNIFNNYELEYPNKSHISFKYADALFNRINESGYKIDVDLEKAIATDDQILYLEGDFIIDNVCTPSKCITDFQESHLDLLNIEITGGTISFSSKKIHKSGVNITFRIDAQKINLNIRHLVDIIVNSNRTIKLAVIGSMLQVIDDKCIIIKPIVIEYIKSSERNASFLNSIKKS